ncbi:AraC family transcriptional regulator [Sediminivirga luteola]|uniref:AraC family transcriptional regulator n=1 Tax=Sediminivirga luteola TaxID=1774748 RepID=A0A8J2TZH2_9MICO|nr:AraC family transcriptional regulator [Sediminivirga luteola]MCI2264248.1 AraC family transcriptional regulator [Sediminivirga luteola]GGA20540.1 AraC family transcriptional regulator [Sediminivirga luteola]
MIRTLNALVAAVEEELTEEIDWAGFARRHATTEYHLRRMFSALAGMPLSEYVRRRRMTLAAADLTHGGDRLLDVAMKYGYGSAEAFGRAFHSVHGASPATVRRDGGPLRTQSTLRFRLSVEGNVPMDVTITAKPELVLAGHAVEVPLIYEGVNPHIQKHVASITDEQNLRLKQLNDGEPAGILAVTYGSDPDAAEGSLLTYMHGVALSEGTEVPAGLDSITVESGDWAVFSSQGPHPEALQKLWAATATDWFPSNPWRLRPGPTLLRYLSFTGAEASCELWMPVEKDG